jgi:uncharacterized metal-binding protein YceD (DUF177 family)
VKAKNAYTINYSSLPNNKHQFEFLLTDIFFQDFEYGEIQNGTVSVQINLDKKPTLAFLEFNFKGTVRLFCDLCLNEIDLPLTGTFKINLKESKLSANNNCESDDTIFLSSTEHQLDLKPYLHEFVHLLLPMRRQCSDVPNQQCDQTMLNKLDKIKVNNKEIVDSDWEALKNIKFN